MTLAASLVIADLSLHNLLSSGTTVAVATIATFRIETFCQTDEEMIMNAVELLKEDHREALELLERLENMEEELDADEEGVEVLPNDLFTQLKNALTLHTQVEEQVFYPAMREFDETRDQISEAIEEHEAVDQILEEMTEMSPEDDEFQDKLEELRENLEHHIEEEEDELFPKAEELCEPKRLDEMGRQIQKLKQGRSVAATTRRKQFLYVRQDGIAVFKTAIPSFVGG
jgi:iron-sulfur cluster repair protein YtfE (RIC family)